MLVGQGQRIENSHRERNMLTLPGIVRGFSRGIAASRIAQIGTVITVVLFPVLALYSILDGLGRIHYPKLSFIVYGGLTWVFILGHVLVFLGLFVVKNKKGVTLFSSDEFKEHFSAPTRFTSIRKLILFVTFLTFFNGAIVAVSAYHGFHYSESVAFCAELCHGVMTPEYTAYRISPHSRVECVECHIGEGATWFVRSKLSGIRQLAAVALDTYSRPIETPIHGLRPARDTCQACHRPELFHGDRLKVKEKFLEDENNTRVRTVLLMKVGSGDDHGQIAQGSHWHVSSNNQIHYAHTDRKRADITEVTLLPKNGGETVFVAETAQQNAADGEAGEGGVRLMDCLDCHNRPTHIYASADEALDGKLLSGEIPQDLPFIKRQAMKLVTQDYSSQDEALGQIEGQLRAWYAANYTEVVEQQPGRLDQAIRGVALAYTENVFPEMKVGFGTYEKYLGHADGRGCFRCHDESHRNAQGIAISQDCELCHLILAEEEPVPNLASAAAADRETHQILRRAGIR
jgi:hypothetical protein